MRNMWLVAQYEYRRMVFRKSFILGMLVFPLAIVALVGLAIVVALSQEDDRPVGYVDYAGVLDVAAQETLPGLSRRIEIRAFAAQDEAMAALEAETIQAFFVFPPDYLQTLKTDLYYSDAPPQNDIWGEFDDFVRANFVADLPEATQKRLFDGPDIVVTDTVNNREFTESAFVNILIPFVTSFLFFMTTMTSAGYMLRIVADEKENRTMEILLTAVSPPQLIGGKTLGLLGVAMSQILLYLTLVVITIIMLIPAVPQLLNIAVPWGYLGVLALFFLPAYALISAMMVAIGSAVTEYQQGQQIAGVLNLLFVIPFFMMSSLFSNPNSPLIVFMTIFPTTSFLTVSLRWGLGSIPFWQVSAGWIILVASALLMVWIAARIFRAGMLRYGQPLNLKSAVAAIKGS